MADRTQLFQRKEHGFPLSTVFVNGTSVMSARPRTVTHACASLRFFFWLPNRFRLPILFGLSLSLVWIVMIVSIAVTSYLNQRFSSSLLVSDLPELVLAYSGWLLKPTMPKHCPVSVNDGGMSNSYKARTYDALTTRKSFFTEMNLDQRIPTLCTVLASGACTTQTNGARTYIKLPTTWV